VQAKSSVTNILYIGPNLTFPHAFPGIKLIRHLQNYDETHMIKCLGTGTCLRTNTKLKKMTRFYNDFETCCSL